MSLIRCPECGKEISDKAGKCPNCGYPFQQINHCKLCGKEIETGQEVCEKCMKDYDIPNINETEKKKKKAKHSTLGLISAIICGVAVLVPLPVFLSFIMCISAMIMSIVDLCIPTKEKHIVDDVGVIVIGVLYCFYLYFRMRG